MSGTCRTGGADTTKGKGWGMGKGGKGLTKGISGWMERSAALMCAAPSWQDPVSPIQHTLLEPPQFRGCSYFSEKKLLARGRGLMGFSQFFSELLSVVSQVSGDPYAATS